MKTERYINAALQLPQKGSFNHHVILSYKALYGFYSNKPAIASDAWKVFHRAKKRFEHEPAMERWRIIRAFLSFYAKIGRTTGFSDFKLGKFLNEVPLSNQDKTGLNVAIKIVELLHYLADRNYRASMAWCDRINSYCQEHLRKYPRIKTFLRMLSKLDQVNYEKKLLLRKTEKLRKKLEKYSSSVEMMDAEIIPYEFIWEEILDLLR